VDLLLTLRRKWGGERETGGPEVFRTRIWPYPKKKMEKKAGVFWLLCGMSGVVRYSQIMGRDREEGGRIRGKRKLKKNKGNERGHVLSK